MKEDKREKISPRRGDSPNDSFSNKINDLRNLRKSTPFKAKLRPIPRRFLNSPIKSMTYRLPSSKEKIKPPKGPKAD